MLLCHSSARALRGDEHGICHVLGSSHRHAQFMLPALGDGVRMRTPSHPYAGSRAEPGQTLIIE